MQTLYFIYIMSNKTVPFNIYDYYFICQASHGWEINRIHFDSSTLHFVTIFQTVCAVVYCAFREMQGICHTLNAIFFLKHAVYHSELLAAKSRDLAYQ